VPIINVTSHVFARVAYGERTTGVVAMAETPHSSLDHLQLPENPLLAVVEGCEKPGNLGAVLRSADAAGLSAVIVADANTDFYNPNVIRASLGTVFTLPVAAGTSAEVLAFLRARNIAMVAARVDAECDYTAIDFRRPTAVILGSEVAGLTAAWRQGDVTAVRLPMLGVADSLNLSVTAAVLFYEALRQRR
jgi:TrmH family RNA methyltransferase